MPLQATPLQTVIGGAALRLSRASDMPHGIDLIEDSLRGLDAVRFLAAELGLCRVDPDIGVEEAPALRPHHYRQRGDLPSAVVAARHLPDTEASAGALDGGDLAAWVAGLVGGEGVDKDGLIATWSHLQLAAGSALMASPMGGPALVALKRGPAVTVPSAGGWLSGPVAGLPEPPVGVALDHEAGQVTITVTAHWSPWAGPGALAHWAQSTVARGWVLVYAHPAFGM